MRKFLLAILIFLCLTSTSFAYRCVYSETVRDSAGNIMANATVRAYIETAGTQATIYEEVDSTTSVSSVSTNSDGSFEFYVDRFDYDSDQKFQIIVTKGSSTKTYDDVTIDRVVMGTYAGDKTLTTTLRVPEGVIYSGTITVSTGTIIAGLYQIFSGTVTGLTKAYPEWWTTNATPGTTNMTTALQAAADSLTSGGNLILQPTTYSFTNLTLDNAGVTLQGSGWGSVLSTTMSGTEETAPALWVLADNVTLKDFKITWATLPTALVSGNPMTKNNNISIGYYDATDRIDDVLIDNVYVYGGKQHGIGVGRSQRVTIRNSKIEGVYATGIIGYAASYLKVTGNNFYDTKDDAFYTDSGDHVNVSGNNILHTYAKGIGVSTTNGVIVDANTIEDTWAEPILVDLQGGTGSPSTVVVSNNTIRKGFQNYGAGEYRTTDIYSYYSSGFYPYIKVGSTYTATITGNSIYDDSALNAGYGGLWLTAQQLSVTGNSLYGSFAQGVYIGSSEASQPDVDYLAMSGNTIAIASGKGYEMIYLYSVDSGIITGNNFDIGGQALSDPWGRFVEASSSTNVMVTNNRVLNNTGNPYTNAGSSTGILVNNNFGMMGATNEIMLSQTTVSFAVDGDTALFTVPTGFRCVLTKAIIVASDNANSTDITIGQNGAESDWLPTNQMDNLDAQYDVVIVMPVPNTTPARIKSYAAGTVIEINVANHNGAAGNTVYLYGILY